MKPFRIAAVLAAVAALAAFLKRPVKQPDSAGTWEPADRKHSHR
jgi:hypothetical protein